MSEIGIYLRERFEEVVEPIDIDQLVADLQVGDRAVAPLPSPLRDRRRGWAVTLAAAVGVLVLVGGVALLFRGNEPGDVGNEPTAPTIIEEAPTSEAQPIEQPPTVPEPEQMVAPWYRVVDKEGVFDGAALSDIIEFEGRLVAVGRVDGSAAVFTSDDGVTWSRITLIESSGGNPVGSLSVVAEGGLGLVALGSKGLGRFEVWTSPDGMNWSEVPQDAQSEQAADVADIVAGGPGLVAVGSVGVPAAGGVDDGVPAIWTSSDGLQWERVPNEPSVLGDSGGIFAVAAGNGILVAVGESWFGATDDDLLNVVWTSTDGRDWSRAAVGGQRRFDVAFFGGVFVTASGWSVDGSTWTAYEPMFQDFGLFGGSDEPGFHEATLFEVVGDRLIAEQRPGMALPWTMHASSDGRTWTDEGIVIPGFDALTSGGPGMIAVGEQGVAVWFDDPADADAYGDLVVLDPPLLPAEDQATADEWLPFRVSVIDSMLAAYNESRFDDWLAAFSAQPELGNGLDTDVEAAFMAANGRWTRTGGCTTQPGYVTCETHRSDDFYGAGGFNHTVRFTFLFSEHTANLIGYEVAEDLLGPSDWFDEHGAFEVAFLEWLGQAHPNESVSRGPGWFGIAAADMPTALTYVDEFVAQSDAYPIAFPNT